MVVALWRYLDSTPRDGLAVEGMPCRWSNISSSGRLSWSWFGRLGAGDILARFRWGKTASAHKLLARVAEVFGQTGNIYESYNMSGGRGGDTGGNYLEHCGGYAWAVVEGAFGIDFGSDSQAAATVTPRFAPSWPSAMGQFRLRGVDIEMNYVRGSAEGVTLKRATAVASDGTAAPAVRVRLVWGGHMRIMTL